MDVETIYEVPLQYADSGFDELVIELLKLPKSKPEISNLRDKIDRYKRVKNTIEIAICGKYVELLDAYKSIIESFVHAGMENDIIVNLKWVNTEEVGEKGLGDKLKGCCGILVPGGFGERGIDGKLITIQYAREHNVPFFGICLGLQCASIEFARNVLGLKKANSTEFDKTTQHPVIDLMEEQKGISDKGGTMRLGSYPCRLKEGTKAHLAYGEVLINERHRHRWEFNNSYRQQFEESGMKISGISPDGNLVEMIELEGHPWFVGCQFHPELKSRLSKAHPLFRDFVAASLKYQV